MTATLTQEKPKDDAVELRPKVVELRRILAPLDFSEHSRKALRYAVKFAEEFGAELEIVNVVTPIFYTEGMVLSEGMEDLNREAEKFARDELERIAGSDAVGKVVVKTTVLTGNPCDEICNHAKDRQTDLLLIATHGRTGLQHFLLGSNAEKILRHAPCPVLVVRDKEHEFV